MHKFWKAAVLIGCVATIAATGKKPEPPEPPKPPIQGSLEYRVGRTLDEQDVTHIRVTSISGRRCYSDTNGDRTSHSFRFDENRDLIRVRFTDVNGITPGKSYVHQLFFKRSDGTIKPGGVFEFRLANPFSATEPKHTFSFVLEVDGADPDRNIRTGTVLGGIYELSESDRNLAVDLEFELKTDIKYTAVCSGYN